MQILSIVGSTIIVCNQWNQEFVSGMATAGVAGLPSCCRVSCWYIHICGTSVIAYTHPTHTSKLASEFVYSHLHIKQQTLGSSNIAELSKLGHRDDINRFYMKVLSSKPTIYTGLCSSQNRKLGTQLHRSGRSSGRVEFHYKGISAFYSLVRCGLIAMEPPRGNCTSHALFD